MSELMTVMEYAVAKKIHPNTVHKWLRDGRLVGVKVGNGWRISADAVPGKPGGVTEDIPVTEDVVDLKPVTGQMAVLTAERDELVVRKEIKKLRAEVDGGVVDPDEIEAFRKKESDLATAEEQLGKDTAVLQDDTDALQNEREQLQLKWNELERIKTMATGDLDALGAYNSGLVECASELGKQVKIKCEAANKKLDEMERWVLRHSEVVTMLKGWASGDRKVQEAKRLEVLAWIRKFEKDYAKVFTTHKSKVQEVTVPYPKEPVLALPQAFYNLGQGGEEPDDEQYED